MQHLKAELKRVRDGTPAVVAPNLLSQQFTVNAPNKVWETDITCTSTHEGGLYLATVIDLFSRQVIGWATESRIDTQLPLDALYTVIWRRIPRETIRVHSDQGCQCTNREWQRFLASRNLQPSMSRRDNCHETL
ncbi:Integrase core domain protein [compost metagenome]